MGLDQYAFARKDGEQNEIAYWRKHADLEGWMSDLYASRGGESKFNCVELQLFKADIEKLEGEHRNLETTTGFFWGTSDDRCIEETQSFIEEAKNLLDSGWIIIYTSWW